MNRPFTPEIREFIFDNTEGISCVKLSDMIMEKFGVRLSKRQLSTYRKQNGLHSGLTGYFEKGSVSFNKGKKQTDFMSPEGIERSKATRFKPGNKTNEQPVGTIRKSDGYYLKKVSMESNWSGKWKFLQRLVWEEHYGAIPDGMLVSFKDGNPENVGIDNLMLITKGEHMAMQKGYRSSIPEVTEAGLNLVRLKLKAKELKRDRRKEVSE